MEFQSKSESNQNLPTWFLFALKLKCAVLKAKLLGEMGMIMLREAKIFMESKNYNNPSCQRKQLWWLVVLKWNESRISEERLCNKIGMIGNVDRHNHAWERNHVHIAHHHGWDPHLNTHFNIGCIYDHLVPSLDGWIYVLHLQQGLVHH